jgi:hypothetical protein
MTLKFTLETGPAPERARLISDPLIDFNESQAGDRRVKSFALFAKDPSGVVLGGLLGSTHWNHFFVSALLKCLAYCRVIHAGTKDFTWLSSLRRRI